MRGKRTEYPLRIGINGRPFNRIIIDQHYRERHSESMTDQLILELVKGLDGRLLKADPEEVDDGFLYLTREVVKDDRPYRLILMIDLEADYLGVINAYRIDRRST